MTMSEQREAHDEGKTCLCSVTHPATPAEVDAGVEPVVRNNGDVWTEHGHTGRPCSPPQAVRGEAVCHLQLLAEPDAGDADGAMMDRPAYELVRLIEAALNDADQITDTPQRPNNIAVWGIRMLLEPYGGSAHRWQWPLCFECSHQLPLHNYGSCDLCDCAITPQEISDGARDEDLDESIQQALRHEREHRG